MNKIKIFLASSIVEFENERKDLEIFIRSQISDEFEEKYNTKIVPIRCENIDPCMSIDRKQDEYNNLIKECEMCFFIFFTRAGQFTQEEFKIAYNQFRNSENHKPKVYVYFKNVPNDMTVEQSIKDFMEEIDKTYHHYYGTFDHIDTIKLRILLNLKIQEMDFIIIEIKNNKCLVDGNEVLSLENVSEFMNSKELQKLKSNLAEIEDRYFKMKPLYAKGEIDDDFRKEYIDVAAKRQGLIDLIEELQKNIFELSLNLSKDEVHGEITPRQKEAYRLLEKGDSEGCLEILNFEELKNEYQRKKLARTIAAKREAKIYIRENKLAIDILKTMTSYSNRFEEIINRYEEIISEAEENFVELNVIHDYAEFLGEQNQYSKAINIAEHLKDLYTNENIEVSVEDYLILLQTLGIFHNTIHNYDLAEKYYKLIIEKINGTNYDKPNKQIFLANSYINLGALYLDLNNFKEAEINQNNALEIHKRLAQDNPEENLHYLAHSYNNLGSFYYKLHDFKNAEEFFIKALEIYIQYAEKSPKDYELSLATIYCNLAQLYHNTQRFGESEESYKKALQILEKLTINNPEAYEPHLADTIRGLSLLYRDNGDFDKAEKHLKSLIVKYERLAKLSPETFNSKLASTYNSIAHLYSKIGNPYETEKNYLAALNLREQLAKTNFDVFGNSLAGVLDNLGLFYCEMNRFKESKDCLTKALKIYEELYDKNSAAFEPELATTYNNLGILYSNMVISGDTKYIAEAEKFFIKSLKIYESLALKNQQAFEPQLANKYSNLGNFYCSVKQYEKAEKYYYKALELYKRLNDLFPKIYEYELSVAYRDLARNFYNLNCLEKSEMYFKNSIEIMENLNNISLAPVAKNLALTYGLFADLYDDTFRYEEAKKCFMKEIEIYENIVNDNLIIELDLLKAYFNYGAFLLKLKDNRAGYYLMISYNLALKNAEDLSCISIIKQLEKLLNLDTPYKRAMANLYSSLRKADTGVTPATLQEIVYILGDCIIKSSENDKNILEKLYSEYINELQNIISSYDGDVANHHDRLAMMLDEMVSFCEKVLNID